MKKQTLCLIFGGNSQEYYVSLKSCACILKNINREKYVIYKIGITKNGKWYFYVGDENKIENDLWEEDEKYPVYASPNTGELLYFNNGKIKIKPDVVFPVIHGAYGEDGRLKGFFDALGIKCVGCSSESGAVTVNKYFTKLIAADIGVPVADFIIIHKKNGINKGKISKACKNLGYPVFVKTVNLGSSIGVYRAKNESELFKSIKKALELSDSVLIEREIKGTETEIALLERRGEILFGKIGQIRHNGDFYGYEEKYGSDKTELVIPAKITKECESRIRRYAKRIFVAAGCCGMCRADFFVTENGSVIFNEVNTVPGFTSGSMYPLLMAENGDVSALIDLICG